jgi:long-chain acyl-CoA synthetase
MNTKSGFYGKGSVEVGPKVEGEGPTRRSALRKDALVTQPFEGINTIRDVLAYAARTHGTKNALGWRDIVAIHEEEKEVTKIVGGKPVKEMKTWKYFQLSDYKYLNFLELQTRVSEVGRGLIALGITTTDVFNVYAQTG